MSNYMMVKDNCLYLVRDGVAMPIEDHYRDQITRSGEEFLEKMFKDFREEPNTGQSKFDMYESGICPPTTNWRRGSKPQSNLIIAGESREKSNPWFWFISGIILFALIVWWW